MLHCNLILVNGSPKGTLLESLHGTRSAQNEITRVAAFASHLPPPFDEATDDSMKRTGYRGSFHTGGRNVESSRSSVRSFARSLLVPAIVAIALAGCGGGGG